MSKGEIKPVTAAEAWEHVKFVYGKNAICIRKLEVGDGFDLILHNSATLMGDSSAPATVVPFGGMVIEWADGAEEWPDGRFRAPTNLDIGQQIEFKHRGDADGEWMDGTFIYDMGDSCNPEKRYAVKYDRHTHGPLFVGKARIRADQPRDAGLVKVHRNGRELLISRELMEDFDAIKSVWDSVWKKKHGMTVDEWITSQAKSLLSDGKPGEPAKPAWVPKPGDWVKIKKPKYVDYVYWHEEMELAQRKNGASVRTK